MLKAQFISMIREPRPLDAGQVAELEGIVNEYPFFESAHLLYTKGLHQVNALNYQRQLRKTAIVANSRAVLYELLHPREKSVLKQVSDKTDVLEEETKPKELTVQNPQLPVDTIEQEQPPLPKQNPVSITSDEIKVIYVTTVPQTTEPAVESLKQPEKTVEPEENPVVVEDKAEPLQEPVSRDEIGILQTIENETETSGQNQEDELNRSIGQEISRSIIQSYVEAEVIKTPDLQKEEERKPLSFTDWLNRVKTESHTISKPESKETVEAEETHEKTDASSGLKEKKQKLSEKPLKEEKKASNIEQNKNIIDKIIEADPGRIKLGSSKFFTPASDAKQSLLENEHLVTETLAKIYALQGNISKAIRAYEILSLKFPQKSVYFASLIEKLKK